MANSDLIDLDPIGDLSLSDAVRNWGGGAARSVSEAGSRVSVRSELHRDDARRVYEEERRRRQEEFERAEREHWRLKQEELDEADLRSEMADHTAEGRPGPAFSPMEGKVKEEYVEEWRKLASRGAPKVEEPGSPNLGAAPWATVISRVKAKEPKAWTGKFDYMKREIWLRSAALYMASIGLSPGASPFKMTKEVFEAVRSHWADTNAAETAFRKYRAARQGTMKAREFGTKLDGLADACFDRSITDIDRRSTFLAGLNPTVSDFVRTQIAALRVLGKEGELDFDKVVEIASATDDLSSFSKKSSVSSSQAGGSSLRANDGPTLKTQENKPAFSSWSDRTKKWQDKHPWGQKSSWFVASGPKPNKAVRCYNCGEMALHFSPSCPNPRRSPAQVVVAALATKAVSPSSSSLSAAPASEASEPMTVAGASIMDLGGEGKA
ncbi:hypothetical protein JCM10296v2_007498 [Rhodotorula toruloides]